MLIRTPKRWELPESATTPEPLFFSRRQLVTGASALALSLPLASCGSKSAAAPQKASNDGPNPTLKLYPAKRDTEFKLDRPITKAQVAETYNNYYEFGTSKDIWQQAQALPIRPWEISIEGLVEKPFKIGADELILKMPLEERLYRHRCVEAWSMAVPWTGFPMTALLSMAKPLSSAKYIMMQTFMMPSVAPGQDQPWYPWPYTEGLTMAEAANELAFLVTGIYGKPLPKQMGAPLRLVVPWKYGFKSVKAIVRFRFQTEQPKTYWETVGPDEYGFWANVNPAVPHPRWSQATERLIGTDERVPTKIFNGYGPEVASLYRGMNIGDKLYR
ncbi:MAG: protein-methionine-sulfoxide reductase catalytic subunit MsrP [Alphaproteobacteria bacterium]|nr:protein-methionine-sulfoxide reductase catalytic subunit MsrP [Alphaproteobacteria bacterium]